MDLYDGGYQYDTNFEGDISEIDDDCYEWSNNDYLCFEYTDSLNDEENSIIDESTQVITVSGHSDDSYNGEYMRGNDWNDAPHYVMDDRHLYYFPPGYWQLDDRDQEIDEFSDQYNGGYRWG